MRRRRAKRVMDVLTVVCVAVVIGIGTSQAVVEGLQEFVNRPPGVGATPSDEQTATNTRPTPEIAQLIPSAPAPTPQPIERNTRPTRPGSDREARAMRDGHHAAQYR